MERDRGVLQPRVHHCKGVVVQCTRHKELQSKCLHFKPDSSNCRTIILATLWPNQKWIIIKWWFSWIIMIANIFQSSPSWIKWWVSASSAVSGWWAKQWEKGRRISSSLCHLFSHYHRHHHEAEDGIAPFGVSQSFALLFRRSVRIGFCCLNVGIILVEHLYNKSNQLHRAQVLQAQRKERMLSSNSLYNCDSENTIHLREAIIYVLAEFVR